MRLSTLAGSPIVGNIRRCGLIAGIQLAADPASRTFFAPEIGAAHILEKKCEEEGLIARPLSDGLALAPPLIIQHHEIDDLMARVRRGLESTVKELSQ